MGKRIIDMQRLYQSSTKPIWMRHPRSPYYLYPFWGLFAVVLVAPLLYIPNAIAGVKAKKN
ncbi:HGR055Cp [Eremothecium sinecaudum]|uniref:HGR055Cp n=1 Tax=Eremothecium sinecaudum TaxID=45286 RepID=A0A0X8HVQ3_9SACH|nr:HGR055Cp [Eremothecium sinecaudum]AMD22394.1 HGR055Cp [Eremothecium sinecaudum]